MTVVAVMNQSTVISDAEVEEHAKALQVQTDRDWLPHWNSRAEIVFVHSGDTPPKGSWWLTYFDNSDQAGALGYHDLTDEGEPLGKVFAGTDNQYGEEPSVTASHELLEMLADPSINICVQVGSRLWAYEVCDAVESRQFAYKIGNVTVSDFVLPEYFEPDRETGPFDFTGVLKQPLTLAPGGYMSYLDFGSTQGWQQQFAPHDRSNSMNIYAARARLGSRRERRRTVRDNWVRSLPVPSSGSTG